MTQLTALAELADNVAALLKDNEQTVAIAESSTGGLISASLLAVPGASAYFIGGSVVYTRQSRKQLLGVSAQDVEGLEPVSEPMVAKFAQIAREQLGATWGLAELGIAGPASSRYGNDPGLSVIAVSGPHSVSTTIQTGIRDRETNMWRFTARALNLLGQAVAESHK